MTARVSIQTNDFDVSTELAALRVAAGQSPVANAAERRALFDRACRLRRQLAFANPLLDFPSLLFLKRHRSVIDHCCDQFYGITQRPGGGLFELVNPFGPQPSVRDVLEQATVANGRLQGQALSGGPQRTWNLTYDGVGNLGGEDK